MPMSIVKYDTEGDDKGLCICNLDRIHLPFSTPVLVLNGLTEI